MCLIFLYRNLYSTKVKHVFTAVVEFIVHCFSNSTKLQRHVKNGKQLETCNAHFKQKSCTILALTGRAWTNTYYSLIYKAALFKHKDSRTKQARKYTQKKRELSLLFHRRLSAAHSLRKRGHGTEWSELSPLPNYESDKHARRREHGGRDHATWRRRHYAARPTQVRLAIFLLITKTR